MMSTDGDMDRDLSTIKFLSVEVRFRVVTSVKTLSLWDKSLQSSSFPFLLYSVTFFHLFQKNLSGIYSLLSLETLISSNGHKESGDSCPPQSFQSEFLSIYLLLVIYHEPQSQGERLGKTFLTYSSEILDPERSRSSEDFCIVSRITVTIVNIVCQKHGTSRRDYKIIQGYMCFYL